MTEQLEARYGVMFSRSFPGKRIEKREDLYMAVAELFSMRSTCNRGQVGCVAVKDNRIVGAGYNGSPPGMPHCIDVGCGGAVEVKNPDWRELTHKEALLMGQDQIDHHERLQFRQEYPNGCTRAIHAEANLVAFAARVGASLDGCTVYATHGPCLPCAQALVAAGIAELWYETPYRLPQGLQLVDQANIRIHRYGKQPTLTFARGGQL